MKNIVLLVGLGLAFNSNAGMIYSADTINSNLRDISTTGTQFNLSDDDVANINIGFNFDFFDNTYGSLQVSSNGFIGFSSLPASGCCSGQALLVDNSYNNLFAGLWEDLDSNNNTTGTMYSQTIGAAGSREFVVGFYDVAHYPSGNNVTFEMILHEGSNNLEIQYGTLISDGGTHTIGIENIDGSQGIEFYRGSNIGQFSNTGVLFAVPTPSTLAVFAFGLFALVTRRYTKS
ncbi:PEP-CTERM sorting domain-containing protein [Colwelliaceae bacterium MEBiC 14330]